MSVFKSDDWEVVCVDTECYAIYRKDLNEEWQDEHGDNLVFETEQEAKAYLQNQSTLEA